MHPRRCDARAARRRRRGLPRYSPSQHGAHDHAEISPRSRQDRPRSGGAWSQIREIDAAAICPIHVYADPEDYYAANTPDLSQVREIEAAAICPLHAYADPEAYYAANTPDLRRVSAPRDRPEAACRDRVSRVLATRLLRNPHMAGAGAAARGARARRPARRRGAGCSCCSRRRVDCTQMPPRSRISAGTPLARTASSARVRVESARSARADATWRPPRLRVNLRPLGLGVVCHVG